jgi:hypothetical protein
MTIEEIERELRRLPATPVTDEDLYARAELTSKKFAIEADARELATRRAAAERKQTWGLPLANVPQGVDCAMTHTGRTVVADIVGERRVMRLTAEEVRQLAVGNPNWTDLNPDLLRF